MADKTKGYGNGDHCPACKKGLVTVRILGGTGDTYAQCAHCAWNSLRS
ncbi:MAG: hypothetical protein KDE03_15135 [Rhodobacteraceae bacterium]|nr:hypothetical protein [Paracoccaceae bacterium]